MRLAGMPLGGTTNGRARRLRQRRLLTSVAALAASALFIAACGGDDEETGGTDNPPASASANVDALLGEVNQASGEPVRIGIITDGASQVADLTIQNRVAEATAEWINERGGGIAGRPIELVECETQNDPAKGAECGTQMVQADVAAVVIGTSGVVETTWQPIADADVPVLMFGTGDPTILADDHTFTLNDPTFAVIQMPIAVAKELGADSVTSVVIDVPAALESAEKTAPPLYEAAGLKYTLVKVPPATADMTAQMQQIANDNPGVVFVIGNDAFCIAAMNGLSAVGYAGQITAISQCISDATRTSVPGDVLEGIKIGAFVPIGVDNDSTRLYNAVVEAYGDDIDLSVPDGMVMFTMLAGFHAALDGLTGDVTPDTVVAALRSAPEVEIPGAGGLKMRCNGKAFPDAKAVCVRGGLVTTLDDEGQPSQYEVLGSSPIED